VARPARWEKGEAMSEALKMDLRQIARSLPSPVKSALARLWGGVRLEYPAFLAVGKRRWQTSSPITYRDKLQYKMARDRRPLIVTFADKLAARDYVAARVGRDVLLEVYDQAESAAGIRWDRLPREFVVKVNHGCRGMIMVSSAADPHETLPRQHDRLGFSAHHVRPEAADPAVMAALCDYWLTLTYNWAPGFYVEWAYSRIKRRAYVEQYVGGDAGPTRNLKVHCFNGVPLTYTPTEVNAAFEEVAEARFLPHELEQAAEIAGLDLTQMLRVKEMCEALSAETDFVRVDWLLTADGLRFSELTNYPAGGNGVPGGHAELSDDELADLYSRSWTVPSRYR
jgi:TupA-like ATPgrasp